MGGVKRDAVRVGGIEDLPVLVHDGTGDLFPDGIVAQTLSMDLQHSFAELIISLHIQNPPVIFCDTALIILTIGASVKAELMSRTYLRGFSPASDRICSAVPHPTEGMDLAKRESTVM